MAEVGGQWDSRLARLASALGDPPDAGPARISAVREIPAAGAHTRARANAQRGEMPR